jgi:exonuclease SbcD
MKLFHAADIHLDSPMRGLAAYDGAPVDELRLATRRALRSLVDAAIDEQVDVVLLAGDLFDGDWSHYSTGVHFAREMGRLREAGIQVVTLAGNHDAESKLTKSLHWPDNVHVLSTRKPETVCFKELGLAVHGQGYATPAVTDDLSRGYPKSLPDMVNIGLLHTSADGRPEHEHYAPCTVEGLRQHGYDYWALGHIHAREVLSEDPPVVFAGNLQGRGLRETGPKGATLVEITEDGAAKFEHRVLDCVRWEQIEVDASGCASVNEVCERIGARLREEVRDLGQRLLAVRIVISGQTDAHQELVRDEEKLRYEVIAAAAETTDEQVWIERVALKTLPPRALALGGDDAVGELIRELEELSGDETALQELAEALRPLADALPSAVAEEFNPMDPQTVRELISDVARSLPAKLLESTES